MTPLFKWSAEHLGQFISVLHSLQFNRRGPSMPLKMLALTIHKWLIFLMVLVYSPLVFSWPSPQQLDRRNITPKLRFLTPTPHFNVLLNSKRQFPPRNFKISPSIPLRFGKQPTLRNTFKLQTNKAKVENSFNWRPSKPLQGKSDAPGAYSWGYRWVDESGTHMFREETADGRGTVWGRYSFREPNGLLRIVEYVSDPSNGFRTRIRSNEPGIVTSNPANAEYLRFENENDIPW